MWAIKLSEKESLIKSFILFFVVMELFLLFIFYNYYSLEKKHINEQLFLEMKNYSFSFDDERFDIDIIEEVAQNQLYELYFDTKHLYILVPLEDKESTLQVMYPLDKYILQLSNIKYKLLWQFILLSLVFIAISLLFSLYALRPLRDALILLEEFIKDIIHDLNTPITSILINLKMLEKNEEIRSIEQSAKAISMLHKNLDIYLREVALDLEHFDIKETLEEQVAFFTSLYDYLDWDVNVQAQEITANKMALSRILYNLLSNACKYNTTEGFIRIRLVDNMLMISNSSYGVKNPKRVFERFYKESSRGLGIGLHIVDKLCTQLAIKKTFAVEDDMVKITLELS